MRYLLAFVIGCFLGVIWLCAAQQRKKPGELMMESVNGGEYHPLKANKVAEEVWTGDRRYHWECPKGSHVYWFEQNVPSETETVPQCRIDGAWKP